MIDLVPLSSVPTAAIEHSLDRAFGTGRHARTAYRLREGVAALSEVSLAAIEDGALIGTVQLWPVVFSGDSGSRVPLVLVGPVAVAPDRQRDGIGRRLMHQSLGLAAQYGQDRAMMLIGDPEYYGRFFGFDASRTGGWRLPGPVERHRLLARGADVPDGAGVIGQRIPAIA